MACTTADADEMIAAADATGVVLVPFQNTRFAAPFVAAAQTRARGSPSARSPASASRSGTPVRRRGRPGRRGSSTRAAAGGGCLIDLGVHAIDLVRCVTGDDITHVSARPERPGAATSRPTRSCSCACGAGAIGTIHASWSSRPGPDHQLTVVGTEGTLHLDTRTPLTLVDRIGRAQRVELPDTTSSPLDELLAAVRGERAPTVTAADGRAAVAVVEAAYRSAATAHAGRGARDARTWASAPRSSRRRRPVQLAGFIEDQPATEVHDDLEVRGHVRARRARRGVPARVRPARHVAVASPGPVRDVGGGRARPRAGGRPDVVHPHPRGPEHARGQRRARLGDARGLPRAARRAVRRRRARGRSRRGARRAARRDAGRCPTGCRSTGAACRTSRRSPSLDVIARRRLAHRHARQRRDPSRRARARVPRGVERLGRPVPPALEARAGGSTMLLSGALGDVNPHHVHRQNNDCGGDGFAEADAARPRRRRGGRRGAAPTRSPSTTTGPTVETVPHAST